MGIYDANEQARAKLEKLLAESKVGILEPREVVKAARALTSPLHGYFEWSDPVAAHQWRLEEARRIIRSFMGSPEATHL